MDLTFTKTSQGISAKGVFTWYCSLGNYRIEVVGKGPTEQAAEANAMLMLGQARATVNVTHAVEGRKQWAAPVSMVEG